MLCMDLFKMLVKQANRKRWMVSICHPLLPSDPFSALFCPTLCLEAYEISSLKIPYPLASH